MERRQEGENNGFNAGTVVVMVVGVMDLRANQNLGANAAPFK